jgi:hypothetical protein
MTFPSKSVSISIKSNTYQLNFPNTGQYIDIQCLKNKITSDNYNLLTNSNDSYVAYATLLVDMIAHFNILIPDLKKDLNVQSILGLDMLESKELLDCYTTQYLPFFNDWMKIITTQSTTVEETVNEDV